MRRFCVFFIVVMGFQLNWAQSSFASGILPRISLSTQMTDRIKWAGGLESRQILFDDTNQEAFTYDYVLTDISTVLSIKIGAYGVLNGGYLLRLEGNQVAHRTIQRYNIVHRYNALRIGHRFATDQTFSRYESPEFRARYRITIEKPLLGDQIDPGEFYIKLGNEYLVSYQENETNLELRILPFLGFEMDPKSKIEFGLDYRIGNLLNEGTENDLWLSFSWFYSFDMRPESK